MRPGKPFTGLNKRFTRLPAAAHAVRRASHVACRDEEAVRRISSARLRSLAIALGLTASASTMAPASSDERVPTLHHAPIQPGQEGEWPPRSHRHKGPGQAPAEVVQLDRRAVSSARGQAVRPAVPKDKRRPAMY